MRWRGLEPPRGCPTRPSTLRVYQFRHQRAARLYPGSTASTRYRTTVLMKKSTAIERRQAREVALDDVGASLRLRREPHASEAGLAAGMHQHENRQRRRDQHLGDCKERDHRSRIVPAVLRPLPHGRSGDDARAKIQHLLVTGDNRLKQGVARQGARELRAGARCGPRGRARGRGAPARRDQARRSRAARTRRAARRRFLTLRLTPPADSRATAGVGAGSDLEERS